jgi:flagellar motor switch protein FliN/FliY
MSNVERLEVHKIQDSPDGVKPLVGEGNLDIVKDVKVTLEVRVGEADMTVDEFMNLGKGSVVRMSHSVTTPVDILLDGKIVARGHLVAADDNFGVQITQLST